MTADDRANPEYNPGDVVLAKVKGYAPWPAMVLEDTSLPEGVLAARPKNRKSAICVRFFVDGTYSWNAGAEIKPLSPEDAKKQLESKSKRDKSLVSAYEAATHPPSLEVFLKSFEEIAKPTKKPRKSDSTQSAPAPKKAKTKAKAEPVEKQPKEPKPKESKQPKESDNAKNADQPTTAKGARKPKLVAKTVGAKLSENLEDRKSEVYTIRHRLQKGFLNDSSRALLEDDQLKNMSKLLTTLEQNPDIELSIIRETKVNKVLKMISKIPDIPSDDKYNFTARCLSLLDAWFKSQTSDSKDNGTADSKENSIESKEEDTTGDLTTIDTAEDETEDKPENGDKDEVNGESKDGEKEPSSEETAPKEEPKEPST